MINVYTVGYERKKSLFTVNNIDLSAAVFINVHMHAKYNNTR